MSGKRETFGSKRTAIFALAGSAIGLGNIWRFPTMVGQGGGAAFIVIYICACFILSLPIFLSESIIGHKAHSSTLGAMKKLAPGTKWHWLGFLTVLAPVLIMSYYSVVGGWSLEYFFKSIVSGFPADSGESFKNSFGSFISNPIAPIYFHTAFLLLTAVIVVFGVKSGIELFNKISMPVLFVLVLAIAIVSVSMPGASEGVRFLVKPDFSKLTPPTIASAVGQSFYSLSLGVGTILTYSSYIHKKENILESSVGTIIFDLLFALLAGFAVMPAVFAAGLEPSSGPGLIFETLPYVFSYMGITSALLSRVVSIIFFFTILIAALTSSISLFEVAVAFLSEELKLPRWLSVLIELVITWSIGVLCSLSFGPLSGAKIFGYTIFNFLDMLSSNFMMTFGGLLFVIFVGWKMSKSTVRDEFTQNGAAKFNCKIFDAVYFIIKYVAPIGIFFIFLTNFL